MHLKKKKSISIWEKHMEVKVRRWNVQLRFSAKNSHQIKNRLEKEVQKHNKSIIWFFIEHYFCSSFLLVLWNKISLWIFKKIWRCKIVLHDASETINPSSLQLKNVFESYPATNIRLKTVHFPDIPSEQHTSVLTAVTLIIQVNSENMGVRSMFYKSQWNFIDVWKKRSIIHWHWNSPLGAADFHLSYSVSTVCCSSRSIMGLCNPLGYFTSKERSLQPHNSNTSMLYFVDPKIS